MPGAEENDSTIMVDGVSISREALDWYKARYGHLLPEIQAEQRRRNAQPIIVLPSGNVFQSPTHVEQLDQADKIDKRTYQ